MMLPSLIRKQWFPILLMVGGFIGFLFSLLITIEKIKLLQNPAYIPPCNISPFISCGSVMQTWQASIFGFPNSLIGIAGFSIVTTIGVALLAGATFRRWFWLGVQTGLLLALVFVYWLFFQSVFRIGALCPYCMVVWAVTIPLFWYVTLYNIHENHIRWPSRILEGIKRYSVQGIVILYLIIIISIVYQFWPYWQRLL